MATGHVSGAIVGGVADPAHLAETDATAQPQINTYNDERITFEEYHHWANRSRELEKSTAPSEQGLFGLFKRSDHKQRTEEPVSHPTENVNEKDVVVGPSQDSTAMDSSSAVTDSEWNNARGAMRTATWGMYTR